LLDQSSSVGTIVSAPSESAIQSSIQAWRSDWLDKISGNEWHQHVKAGACGRRQYRAKHHQFQIVFETVEPVIEIPVLQQQGTGQCAKAAAKADGGAGYDGQSAGHKGKGNPYCHPWPEPPTETQQAEQRQTITMPCPAMAAEAGKVQQQPGGCKESQRRIGNTDGIAVVLRSEFCFAP